MKIISLLLAFVLGFAVDSAAQLKFVVEDFEGMTENPSELKTNGVFTYGCLKAVVDTKMSNKRHYSGERSIRITKDNNTAFGGWGIGVGSFIELDYSLDHFNFYIFQPQSNGSVNLKIELQEDDNSNNVFDKQLDDSWEHTVKLEGKNAWELISIPLSAFKDANQGGDDSFNASYKHGRFFTVIFSLSDAAKLKGNLAFSFDFISFSQGKMPTGSSLFDAPSAAPDDHCSLGAWSKEGNMANFSEIASSFESPFKPASLKKLGVVHFFQPFAVDGGNTQNLYPSVERINKIIKDNYIPMITLEDHFVNAHPGMKQPNLYSIVEGHFDSFFADWAKQMKKVQGTVLLRILHEFNGDWYPWCVINNDKNPKMVVDAYRHIYNIFKRENVTNVRFIWCPNSKSIPQESWNFIMDAYPGDEYVDYVGLDIYNGAGKATTWRSFRKEGIENYFIARQRLPYKPIFICEVASRERDGKEEGETKAEWIKNMSEALKTDFSGVRMLAWFNEKSTFKVNTSDESRNAFLNYIMKDEYFKSGTGYLDPMIQR
jgi:beta-mannanase